MADPATKRPVKVFASLCAVLAGIAVVGATPDDPHAVVRPDRIMFVGDSITRGTAPWGEGFRLPVIRTLVAERYASDMVGAANSGPPWLYDRNHDGFGGFGIDDIAARVVGDLNTYQPDYVLLMIGSNDVQWDWELDVAPDKLSSLIDSITNTAPAAQVVVASITLLGDPAQDNRARVFNAAIPGIVEAKASAGKKVSFVDMYPVLTLADLPDGVHPNDGGYAKLAAAWSAKLATLRPAPAPASTRICPCTIWGTSDAPTLQEVASTQAAEVGVKFRPEKDGFITGVRFYKGPNNTGTHTVSLWKAISDSSTYTGNQTTISGTLLQTATATEESAAGWQEVVFSAPLQVRAHTLYFASYYAPLGRYAADAGYFTEREIVHSPLRLPSQGSIDGNGFIRIGSPGLPSLPSSAWNTNYWVDVVFVAKTPTPPVTVTATAVSAAEIDVAWSTVADASGYRLERSLDNASWTSLATVAAAVTSYNNTGLLPATTYYYRIVAVSNGAESTPSAATMATTDSGAPESPVSVSASPVSSTQISVGWSSVSGATGYRVERSTDGAAWAPVATLSGGVTTHSDTGLSPATTYQYRVVATNAGGDSSPSPVASATTLPLPPAAPATVTATTVSSSQINVAWSAVSGATGYRLERSPDGTAWVTLATTTGATSYAHTGLSPATTYRYRVVATNAGGESSPSAVATATTLALPPAAPASASATAVSSSQINLAWSSVANATGYRVERSTNGSTWAALSTTSAGVTAYSNTGLLPSTTYYYRIVATNAAGDSPPSPVASAATLGDTIAPTAPANLKAASPKGKVNLSWAGSTDSGGSGLAGYRVWRSSTGASGVFSVVATTTAASYSDGAVTADVDYWYRVTAVDAAGNQSPPSNLISARPK